jgi:hypothetical protein
LQFAKIILFIEPYNIGINKLLLNNKFEFI